MITTAQTERDQRMYEAGRARERRRPRKSGSAVDARPYRHHIAVRMTYYEAEVLDRLLTAIDEFSSDGRRRGNGHVPSIFSHPQEKRAFGRLVRKANSAASLEQPVSAAERKYYEQVEAARLVVDPDVEKAGGAG